MSGKKRRKKSRVFPIYAFGLMWLIFALLFPLQKPLWLVLAFAVSTLFSFLCGRSIARKEEKRAKAQQSDPAGAKKDNTTTHSDQETLSPDAAAIMKEGQQALRELGRLYAAINDPEIRTRINDVMLVTDKMAQDALEDPSDIPQIKKFFSYFLPTTIKLLNAYDRMSAQGIRGENLDKSMNSITEMLDSAVTAYRKRLDDLFANQALDIETDIEVLNTMLAREGLAGTKEFSASGFESKTERM